MSINGPGGNGADRESPEIDTNVAHVARVYDFFAAADLPGSVVGELAAPLAAGSYLALSHLAADVSGDEMAETFRRLNAQMAESVVLRTREQVAGLFGGLELVEPGVVQLPQWRPEPDAPAPGPLPMWCGVGRKATVGSSGTRFPG